MDEDSDDGSWADGSVKSDQENDQNINEEEEEKESDSDVDEILIGQEQKNCFFGVKAVDNSKGILN